MRVRSYYITTRAVRAGRTVYRYPDETVELRLERGVKMGYIRSPYDGLA